MSERAIKRSKQSLWLNVKHSFETKFEKSEKTNKHKTTLSLKNETVKVMIKTNYYSLFFP